MGKLTDLRDKMAEKDAFTSFLFAAAIAGVSIGGTWMLSGRSEERQAVKEMATLVQQVDQLSTEVRTLSAGLNSVLTLTVRVEYVEKLVDRQQQALESIRMSRVPEATQRVIK